jgi:hypothetical protein
MYSINFKAKPLRFFYSLTSIYSKSGRKGWEMKQEEIEDIDYREVCLWITSDESDVINEIIAERKSHRNALSNLNCVYGREDSRRTLDNLPYKSCTLLPVVRSVEDRMKVMWVYTETMSFSNDLKIKFQHYQKIGNENKSRNCHELIKKIEDASARLS